jgi:hypothetical protein
VVGEQPLVKQLYGDDRIERQVHPLVNPRREGQQVLAGIAEVLFIHAFAGAVATLVHEPTTRVRTASVKASTAGMAVAPGYTVLSDTWLVYPGYRATGIGRHGPIRA